MDFCDKCHYEFDGFCLRCETAYCTECDGRCSHADYHDAWDNEDDYPLEEDYADERAARDAG